MSGRRSGRSTLDVVCKSRSDCTHQFFSRCRSCRSIALYETVSKRDTEVRNHEGPSKSLLYGFGLPMVNHVFLPTQRVMVQVQSTRFPFI